MVEDANGFRHDPNEACQANASRAIRSTSTSLGGSFDGLLHSAIGRLRSFATLELRVPIGDVHAED